MSKYSLVLVQSNFSVAKLLAAATAILAIWCLKPLIITHQWMWQSLISLLVLLSLYVHLYLSRSRQSGTWWRFLKLRLDAVSANLYDRQSGKMWAISSRSRVSSYLILLHMCALPSDKRASSVTTVLMIFPCLHSDQSYRRLARTILKQQNKATLS